MACRWHRSGVDGITLEEAYRKWADQLVAFASTVTARDDAADAVADVFNHLLAHPARWDDVRDPRGYLFRCVANATRANGRSASRRYAREDKVWSTGLAQIGAATESSAVLVDQRIGQAVAALSSQQRSVVFLTYWLDEPVDRVAKILGVRPGTVRRQLARARHRLRGELS